MQFDWITTHKTIGNFANSGWTDFLNASSDPANWDKPGAGDAFDINTTNANAMTITAASQDTLDGVAEPQAQAILLSTGFVDVNHVLVTAYIPSGVTTGEFGLVFGYKSGADYWMRASNMNGHIYYYHVVSGVKNTIADYAETPLSGASTYYVETGTDTPASFADGYPSGRCGLFTTIAGMQFFGTYELFTAGQAADLGRWESFGPYCNALYGTTNKLGFIDYPQDYNLPVLVKGLKLQQFQATFSMVRGTSYPDDTAIAFVFNGRNVEDTDRIWLPHIAGTSVAAPVIQGGTFGSGGVGTSTPANMPAGITGGTELWYRITNDGSTVTVKCLAGSSAPSEGDWSGASAVASASSYADTGGRIGFLGTDYNQPLMGDVTIQSWNGSSWVNELVDSFSADSDGYASDTLTYDNNDNLTYDGTQAYTYDAWNRLITVAHAYSASGTVHAGQVFATMSYDALGRRIVKAITGTGIDDCTYNYYLNGNSVIEEQNGSGKTIKDHVWGLGYVDEAVQTRINTNPTSTPSWSNYYHLQDANYNDLGIVDSSGNLVERYEYSPYGQRQAFYSPGVNDPGCYASTLQSVKVVTAGSVTQPYGINEIGDQGLFHDEGTGLVYDRARMLNPTLGRFMQQDPLGYIDAMNSSESYADNPINLTDPSGMDFIAVGDRHVNWSPHWGHNGYNHYALEYWSTCRGAAIPENTTVSAEDLTKAGDVKLNSIELEPDPDSPAANWFTKKSGAWFGTTVWIGVVTYGSSYSDRIKAIYSSTVHSNVDVNKKWHELIAQARTYPYGEQENFGGVFQHWPNSEYAPWGNNCNTFIWYVLQQTGLFTTKHILPNTHEGNWPPGPPPHAGYSVPTTTTIGIR